LEHRLTTTRLFLALPVLACAAPQTDSRAPSGGSEFLYLWTAAADSSAPDYLAVVDVRPDTGRYGRLVSTLPVAGTRNGPHHTEHELAPDRYLFANGWMSGRTIVFDLRDGSRPAVAAEFTDRAGFSHPHSFFRLSNGNVLATFQMRHDSSGPLPGGLVELTPAGEVVRSSPAGGPGVPSGLRVYSAGLVPALDRIVTTTTDMDRRNTYRANTLQIWRLSTLELLHTITLPDGPLGDEAGLTAEPRILADGRTVLVTTFNCGVYLLEGLDGDAPAGRLVATFPRSQGTYCAIPVIAGRFLIITVPAIPAVVALDVSDPTAPHEVSRLTLNEGDVPHWLALEPGGRRLVITGYRAMANRVLLASVDAATGALALDHRFRDEGSPEPGLTLPGVPHGAVFSLSGAPR
jgi:hypothetical protein